MENPTFKIEITEFRLPNGEQHKWVAKLDLTAKEWYEDMENLGCRFEMERLRTGEFSVTISNEERDLDIEILDNHNQIVPAFQRMLKRGIWKRQLQLLSEEENDC